MTAPTYPRIATFDDTLVIASEGKGFACRDAYQAEVALNALNAAFNAGMRHAIDMMKEQSDDGLADAFNAAAARGEHIEGVTE